MHIWILIMACLILGGILGYGVGFLHGEKYFRKKYVDMRK